MRQIAISNPISQALETTLDNTHQLFQEGLLSEGFSLLVGGLHNLTQSLSQEEIDTNVRQQCLQHPVAKILLQEPMTKWSFQKPRGYSGDADLIDYMYRLKPCDVSDSHVGRELYGVLNQANSTRSVRWRSNHLAQQIEQRHMDLDRPISVMSVASGHLRELAYLQNADEKIGRLLCIDQDTKSNQLVRKENNHNKFLEVKDESLTYILKKKLGVEKFDLIYSAGLFDYLNDKLASKLIECLYDHLAPGAILIVPNFLKGITEKAYMETFMKWNLIYRNEEDMRGLIAGINLKPEQVVLYEDGPSRVVYMKITKPN